MALIWSMIWAAGGQKLLQREKPARDISMMYLEILQVLQTEKETIQNTFLTNRAGLKKSASQMETASITVMILQEI